MSFSTLHQYFLPKHALTRFAGWCAHSQARWWVRRVVPWFIRRYGVNMAEASASEASSYPTFNAFFTRTLKPGARPLARAHFVCPVDGTISQHGAIERDQLFQAKGHHYSTRALVGGDAGLAAQFDHGAFATIYLSPKDYHRVHMPVQGRLRRMIYVPGDLFSVSPKTASTVPGLFARNERVVCVFDVPYPPGQCGADGEPTWPFVLVLVGAAIVGSMATAWHGVVNPPRTRNPRHWTYDDPNLVLAQGQEMGTFLLGSTVVMLWPPHTIAFPPEWRPGHGVRMGQAMGQMPAIAP